MTNSQRISGVRGLLQSWFQETHGGETPEMEESILIRDGFYCGRRFRHEEFSAVWFVEEDQIKLYDPRGELIESLSIEKFRQGITRRAA